MGKILTAIPVILLITAWLGGREAAYALQSGDSEPAAPSVALYVLSRGKGVPEPARQVLREARAILEEAQFEGKVVRLKQTRLGLEGETRLCAEFKDREVAEAMIERLRALTRDVELVNLVVERCVD